jgi:hypothetical protein
MYLEAIKWAMGLESADVAPRPAPSQSGERKNDGADATVAGRAR